MNNREKNDLLEDLLKDLYKDNQLNDIEYYINILKKIYNDDFRHEYSRITKFLVGIDDSESADMLIGKIDTLEQEINDVSIKRNIEKLKDHITLENIRLSKLRDLAEAKNSYNDILDKYNKLEEKIKNISEVEKKIDEKFENNNNQSITILGIFSGVVMAFTGGLSFIASSLQNINAISKYRLLFVIILLSMGIFNTIFMLIYMIGKLTNKYIGSKCNCDNPYKGCNEKDIKCAIVRYPLVIVMNIFCIFLLLSIFLIYLLDKLNAMTYLLSLTTKIKIITLLVLSVVVMLIFFILMNVIKKIINIECKYRENPGLFAGIRQILQQPFIRK